MLHVTTSTLAFAAGLLSSGIAVAQPAWPVPGMAIAAADAPHAPSVQALRGVDPPQADTVDSGHTLMTDMSVLPRRDGIVIQAVEGGDMQGYNDTHEVPDRAEADAAVAKIAEPLSRFGTHGRTRRI